MAFTQDSRSWSLGLYIKEFVYRLICHTWHNCFDFSVLSCRYITYYNENLIGSDNIKALNKRFNWYTLTCRLINMQHSALSNRNLIEAYVYRHTHTHTHIYIM